MIIIASIIAVVVGVGWIAFGEINTTEAAYADASLSLVNHQTGRMGSSLDNARTFISTEISSNIGQATDLDVLMDQWSPKYRQAQTSYRRFSAAISSAERTTEEYFTAQRSLTEGFISEELRARARAEDDAEFAQYEAWRERAGIVQEEALEILGRLSDMDTTLQKLRLRSDFSFDPGGFSAVPSDILALEEKLAQFRIASDNIREMIASPFEVE